MPPLVEVGCRPPVRGSGGLRGDGDHDLAWHGIAAPLGANAAIIRPLWRIPWPTGRGGGGVGRRASKTSACPPAAAMATAVAAAAAP